MLDALGERYGMLPSELLERANTFDLWVYDAAVSWINNQQSKADGKPINYNQTDLQKRMEKLRNDPDRRK